MRVLLTNNTLGWRAGSELYLLDVARELKRLGHEPVAYSPHLGDVAAQIRADGIPVVASLASLPFRPDVIHGQHHVETMTALAALPGVPAVSVCHGFVPWEEMPPVFPRILRYVAVDMPCRERILRDAGVAEERVCVILNFADMDRFRPRQPLPSRPLRALVFGNNACGSNYAAAVGEACAEQGIALDLRGIGSGNVCAEPHTLLPQYDIVFAKARAAIEAMATGCAVVLCSDAGLGPMVTSANFPALRPLNFGFRTLCGAHTVENIGTEIRAYDPADAARVCEVVRAQADMRRAVAELVGVYEEVIAENSEMEQDPVAEMRAMGAYLQTLDTVLKHRPFGTAIIAPPVKPPDMVALPPVEKRSWLQRLFGGRRKAGRAAGGKRTREGRG